MKNKFSQFLKSERSFSIFLSISLVLIITGSIVFNLCKNGETLLDESVVSLAAFTMLIYTSYLQNKDLKLTRKELEMTREELKGTKEVQEKQKDQMIKSNEMMKETIIQSRYFELLRVKEDTYKLVEDEKAFNLSSYIRKYKLTIINKLIRSTNEDVMNEILEDYIINNIEMSVDDYKEGRLNISEYYLNSILKKRENGSELNEILKTVFNNIKPSCNLELSRNKEKLYKTHKIIVDLIKYIDEKNRPKGFNSKVKSINDLDNLKSLLDIFSDPVVKTDYTLYELYNLMLLKEEKLFYKCVNNELSYEELLK